MKRALLTVTCAALLALGGAAPALAATGDPLWVFTPAIGSPQPPPTGSFEGPCGLGVDSKNQLYVSDYYHHAVDYFSFSSSSNPLQYEGQLANVDPLDGPCGLALDSSNHLYVNDFDRNLVRYGSYSSFGAGTIITGAGADSAHPTGVAVKTSTDDVYVDERTYITGYDSSGVQLMDGANPLQIGAGNLGEGYGLAVDSANGYTYVADASTDTVKAYYPATDKVNPALTITGPPGGFSSLRQAALAVDQAGDLLYVIDDLHPTYTEEPAAQVEVFNASTGSYLGVLKYQIVDALPAGITVSQANGRVYVTSGNTEQAGVYAYSRNSQVSFANPPAVGLTVSATGSGAGAVTSSLGGLDCSSTCSTPIRSGAEVTLSATPDPGSSFAGWSGGGCGGAGECAVQMDQAAAVSAEFEADSSDAAPAQSPGVGDGSSSVPATAPTSPTRGSKKRPHRRRHRAKHRHHRHHTKRHHHRRVRHRHHPTHRKSR